MDFFAHGLWSYIFFNKTKKPWLAVIFGLLPDTISWGLYFVFNLLTGSINSGPPIVENIPGWVFGLYGLGHSIIVAVLVILIVSLIIKKVPIFMLTWPVAIVMDIFTHTREFLPTPFLWPVSDWKFPGISWGTKTFIIVNYSLIIVCLGYIFLNNKTTFFKRFRTKKLKPKNRN
ncbi:MAG: hypothetical protein ABH824_05060 [Nanoarchaeota archaeon]|nr:hypothetical protein [Nanoarchaeota archaeon]MBU1632465.1 hypothetical protein [Nanoarchaeota archaeon]MBU1876462.1 hypothetical protein [Nanoarchaeota archaeon]